MTEVARQSGPDQEVFRNILKRIFIGDLLDADYNILKTKFFFGSLSAADTYICPGNATKDSVNEEILLSLGEAVFILDALRTNGSYFHQFLNHRME